ncbi:HlyD family type I secretion periplasmic adaptor subunit [Consotaella salsifontis]|uniref:Membrane fusion protein (MFP) family protein n=1 Tax=Consotaella salsifontis TaxID=1365950 RepID=A0A1T4P1D0_9HYPH|nr:HlyD family type I secretion periplasmic adaptor subunit [Consotaella salsifontis]SJZ85192.1 HlyD family secretion protein [Consotaella salsifontis]
MDTAGANDGWATKVRTGIGPFAAVGFVATGVFVGSFGVWAALAPLAGAAVAPGVVAAAGRNQQVQHLEGGIVRQILVREGERIKANEPLFVLDATSAQASRNRLQKHQIGLAGKILRLIAERDGLRQLAFPPTLIQKARKEGVEDLLTEQEREFVARLSRHQQEQTIMQQRINSLHDQIDGMSAQDVAIEQQLKLVRDEAARKESLLAKGLTNRSEYTALLRSEADLVGQSGQTISSILSAKAQLTEAEEQLTRLGTQRVETALTQLNEAREQAADVDEQLRAAEDILERLVVRAPSDGIVISMKVNTEGSVVSPGQGLLELLPTNDDLLVEAHVPPKDIDLVSVGQPARLRFSALNTRTTPTAQAVVTYVSADRLVDEKSGQPFYTARLKIADALPAGLDADRIYPGMPVEAYIATGERTFLEYLVKPIADSFSRAFRED